MPDWNTLVTSLSVRPRENGTVGLAEAADDIARRLELAGLDVHRQSFEALPHEPVALGIAIFALCGAYAIALRFSHPRKALLVSLGLLALPVLHLDWRLPLTPGWTASEVNVEAALSAPDATRRIVLVAHYDSKTEMTDHAVRLPVQLVGAVLGLVALAVAFACAIRPDHPVLVLVSRGAAFAAALYGVVFAVVFAGGALRSDRSPGALDNAAACAVLIRAAESLVQGPVPVRTDVVFLFTAAEEVGAQGAWHYVDGRLPSLRPLETSVLNLDPIGASSDLTVVHREGGLLRAYAPTPALVNRVDAAHRTVVGAPISHTSGGGLTDAFPFLARGVSAVTVISAVPPFVLPRGMHTPADRPDRVDAASLDLALGFVLAFIRQVDAEQ